MGSCSLMWKQCNKKPHYITLKSELWRYHYITLQLTLHCLMLKVSIRMINIHYSAHCVWLNCLSVNITLFDFVSEGAPGRLIQSPNIGWKTKISTGIKEKDSVLAELRIYSLIDNRVSTHYPKILFITFNNNLNVFEVGWKGPQVAYLILLVERIECHDLFNFQCVC